MGLTAVIKAICHLRSVDVVASGYIDTGHISDWPWSGIEAS